MAFVQRRVFYGKAGVADQLVQHLKEGDKALQKYGFAFKSRLPTDYNSGRSDRVAAEWEVDNLTDIDVAMNRTLADPQAQAEFKAWEKKLIDLMHYSEVYNRTIR